MASERDVVFAPHARPDVEVLVDEQWRAGELRAWFWREDAWWANVSYSLGPAQTYLDTVPADRVRETGSGLGAAASAAHEEDPDGEQDAEHHEDRARP